VAILLLPPGARVVVTFAVVLLALAASGVVSAAPEAENGPDRGASGHRQRLSHDCHLRCRQFVGTTVV
jgi:hypothetical protein